MHVHICLHRDHGHDDLLGRISHELGNALDWVTGPGMTEQERSHQTLADVRNRRFEDTVL